MISDLGLSWGNELTEIWAGLREPVLCALATGGYYVHQVIIAVAAGKKIPGVSVAWLQKAQGRAGRGHDKCLL